MQRSSGAPAGYPELGMKDLTSKGDRLLFGRWLKGKLEDAQVLEIGDVICDTTFDMYGTDFLEFYEVAEGELLMRFAPK